MGAEHPLGIQPPRQLFGVGDLDHLPKTVPKTLVQCLVTGDRGRRGIVLTAKGKEELDHVLRIAVFSLAHVDLDPRFDGFLSKQIK